MELKFVWIEEYKNIKTTGINFNHSVDEEFTFINNILSINPKVSNVPRNFFKDNITGVTAIVGKNGSGKTNLTEFINFNLAHFTNGSMAIYYKGYKGILIMDNCIFYQETIIIKNIKEFEKLGYKIYEYLDVPFDKDGWSAKIEMYKNKYIYYSSAFEFRYINMRDNLTNISTSYLAFNDIYNSSKHYTSNLDYTFRSNDKTDSLTAHYINEMVRESDFILNFNAKEFIGESPSALKISIDLPEENRLLNSKFHYKSEKEEEILENKLWEELRDLENKIWNYGFSELSNYKLQKEKEGDYEHYLIPIDKKKDFWRRLFLINLFKVMLNTGYSFKIDFFHRFIYEGKIEHDVKFGALLLSIDKNLNILIDSCEWEEEKVMLRNYESNYNSREKIYFELIRNAQLNVLKEKKVFLQLVEFCKEITKNRLFFHYQFSNNYSSGQQNLLNIYSRFYWAKTNLLEAERNDTYEFKREKIIIFIDEGEIALHPEWQKLFFNKITAYLSELFKDRKIQLILTTHSPFVLSDIPKENVVFLDRDKNGNSIISTLEKENTFGANIHDLLADNFFLQDGLIGDFAKMKIAITLNWLKIKANEVNKSIKNKNSDFNIDPAIEVIKFESNEEEFTYHKQIINLIGEPLVRNKLLTMYFEYVQEDTYALNSELEKARLRVIELEKRMNS